VVGGGGGVLTYPKHLTFIPNALANCPPFSYIPWLKGGNFVLQNKTVYFGEQPWFQFLSDGPIELAYCKNK